MNGLHIVALSFIGSLAVAGIACIPIILISHSLNRKDRNAQRALDAKAAPASRKAASD